jgi:hypothetical protein
MSKKTTSGQQDVAAITAEVSAALSDAQQAASEGQTPEAAAQSAPRLVRYVGERPAIRVGGSFNVDVEAEQQEGA